MVAASSDLVGVAKSAASAVPRKPAPRARAVGLYELCAVTPSELLGPFVWIVLAMIPIVHVLERDDAPAELAIQGLGFEAALLALLWATRRRARGGALRVAGYGLVGVGPALLAAFTGAHSGISAFVAALLVLVGLANTGSRDARRQAQAAYLSLAAGQALLVALTLASVVPDRALEALVPEGLARWRVGVLHVALQGVYLAAFLLGSSVTRRYGEVLEAANLATRATIHRESLIAEALAEHQLALRADGGGVFAGQRVGPYRLGALIGRGGMGEIYDAIGDDGRAVAVKVMRGDRLSDPSAVERLLREAATLARIASPYVAAVYDAGRGAGELPYLAMERLHGTDLEAILASGKPLPLEELRTLIEHGSRALEVVHGAGLVHGDVTPANLMRVVEGGKITWKLVDFGLVRSSDEEDLAPVGTLRFAAPELLRGDRATPSADIYAFGLCLLHASSGRAPLPHDDHLSRLQALAGALEATGRSSQRDRDLLRVLALTLEEEPSARFGDAAALRDAALCALEGRCPAALRERAERLLSARSLESLDDASTEIREVTPTLRLRPRALAGPPRARVALAGPKRAPRLHADPVPAPTWDSAYLAKITTTCLLILTTCVGGSGFILLLAGDTMPSRVALAASAAIASLVVVVLIRVRRGGLDASPRSLWFPIAALSVGPSYYFGLTSAFSAVVAMFLFHAGVVTRASTRSDGGVPWFELKSLASVVTGYSIVAAAILTGVLPDAGLYPVLEPGAPLGEVLATLVVIQLMYVGALGVAYRLDVGYHAAILAADGAARDAARAQALLVTARQELRRALRRAGPGLFTGHSVGGYRLGELVGRGGMGEVYDATHVETGRRAAVKLLRVERLGDSEALDRFLHEAAALRRLAHDSVARVYDVGGLDGELPYIAMEFLDGMDLSTLLQERALTTMEIGALIHDVACGLDAAHAAGVVHRDLKPRNLVRVGQGGAVRWKVVDFGVAKLLDVGLGTTGRMVVGTPGYMAPEQAAGCAVDARADVYSLGLILYRLVVGRPAVVGQALALDAVRLPDPRAVPGVSEDMARVLRLALAPHPRDRYASATELLAAYRAARRGALPSEERFRAESLLARCPWR